MFYYFQIKKNHLAILDDAFAYCGLLASGLSVNLFHKLDASIILLLTALFFLYASLIGLFSLPYLRFNYKHVKAAINENWNFSRWLIATAMLQWFSGNFFIIASGAILGPVAIGATRMAQNLVGLTHVIFLAMENTIPAKAAHMMRIGGSTMMLKYLRQFTQQMGIIILIILLTLTLTSGYLINTFYDDLTDGGETAMVTRAKAASAPAPANDPQIDRSLPAHLPRDVREHLPEISDTHQDTNGQSCGCTACGARLRRIGQDVSEQLEYVPARFKVIRHVHPKLACVACHAIFQASAPSRPIARVLAGAGLLAHVLVSKY